MKTKSFELLHILGALGAGGMTASFFFLINYMTYHPGDVFISFDVLMENYLGKTDTLSLVVQAYIAAATAAALLHFTLLKRWFSRFQLYKTTDDYQQLIHSNREVQLMAIPLTLSMTMNVFFILGALYIPGLFSSFEVMGVSMQVIDPMFVVAGIYFSVMLIMALKYFGRYFMRLIDGNLDFVTNANLSQMLAIFSFGMIGVGFGALGFSNIHAVSFIGSSIAYVVLGLTVMLAIIKFVLGFKSMFEHGIKPADTVTLLIPITIIAMLTVGSIRADLGLMNTLDSARDTEYHLIIITMALGLSLLVGGFAISVMRKKGFFSGLKKGEGSAGSLALICPGFALEVILVQWLAIGLVHSNLVAYGSWMFYALWIPMIALQWVTIIYLFKLLKQHNFLKLDVAGLTGVNYKAA